MRPALAAALILVLLATAGLAGPLAPVAGPVGPTMKTLTEVEPRTAINATNTPGDGDSVFKITQGGSYYLTGNVVGTVGKSGIEISASHVTIDLNGFSLIGIPGTLDGICSTGGGCHDVVIHSGIVTAFSGDGIDLTSNDIGAGGSIHDVHTRFNGGTGVVTNGASVLERCTAFLNGAAGFQVRYDTVVTGCTAITNGTIGFYSGVGCSFTRCIAEANGGDGFDASTGNLISGCIAKSNQGDGVQVGAGSIVEGCSLQYNGSDGIRTGAYVTVRNNTCDANGMITMGAGIHITGGHGRVEGNACNNADFGIDLDGSGTFVVKNTCSNNATNWSFAAGNLYGPIIERTGPLAPAVSGNAAASTLTSTDPNANFTH